MVILSITIIFALNSCSYNKKQLSFNSEKEINLILIPYPDILGISMQIMKDSNLLFINDFRGDTLIHVFDIQKQKIIKKIIPVGNGPNELISPLEIHFSNNELFIFCRQTSTAYIISKKLLLAGSKNMEKLFQVSHLSNHLYPLNDSLFLSSGLYEKRYSLINNHGGTIYEFGEYPTYWYEEKNIPIEARAMFHQVDFEKNPSAQMFVTFSSHILEIYDYHTNIYQPILVKSILMGNYNYKYTTGSVLSVRNGYDVERGIKSVAVSSKYIFIVYSERKDDSQNADSQIRIIDWEGNPIKILKSNKEINCLVIDENEQKGYCIISDPDDSLAYFDLYEII
ncbi:hypothetical protein AGMMS49574_00490 [Bacteroidia bacterium]|nr:hypothetical protein AGMMS49574_00490 [Bacteroidia bacterium]